MDFTLYHYYEKAMGPLKNLSALDLEESGKILQKMKSDSTGLFAAQRSDGYMERRVGLEKLMRNLFIKKGGIPEKPYPHYFVVEECPWLNEWYNHTSFIAKKITEFDCHTISFTYGDSFPTFSERVRDRKEYRGQVYTFEEICLLIDKYGYPQKWNPEGQYGPERYIEAHIWSDRDLRNYL